MLSMAAILFFLIRNGLFHHASLERTIFRIPGIGRCLETICLARFCWSLGLLLESGMDVRRVIPYAFDATGSCVFMQCVFASGYFICKNGWGVAGLGIYI